MKNNYLQNGFSINASKIHILQENPIFTFSYSEFKKELKKLEYDLIHVNNSYTNYRSIYREIITHYNRKLI